MDNKHSSSGIGILGVIQVVLIILKVLGIAPVATWAWSVVLIPLWINLGLIAVILIISVIYLIITKKY